MTSSEYQRRERQFEIDRITARYAAEFKSGRKPDLADYLTRYPDYAAELADFIATYHLALVDLPEPDETPEPVRSPAFARALAAIRAREEAAAAHPALTGLVDRALDAGLSVREFAERVRLSPSIVMRLDAHAIAGASIPRELFRRLAVALDVQVEAVMGFLGASPQASAAFFYADEAPATIQDDFLTVLEASDDLAPDRKAEWRQISASEANG